jgi:hypothetical protein
MEISWSPAPAGLVDSDITSKEIVGAAARAVFDISSTWAGVSSALAILVVDSHFKVFSSSKAC